MQVDCLKNIIGLSSSECPCLPDAGELDSTTSLSGLFVDNMQYGVDLKITQDTSDCGQGSVWDIMDQARCEAINDFITMFQLSLDRYKLPKYENYKGFFGEKAKNGNSNRTGLRDVNGFCLFPKQAICGATICINSIHLGINAMNDYDIIIRNENDGTIVHTETVTVDSTFSGDATGLSVELPMTDEYGEAICYSFAYDRKGALPKNYKYHCGCSSTPLPNWQKDKLMACKGFSVADFDQINKSACNSDYTNGLIVKWSIKCNTFDWMCDVDDDFWCNTKFGRVVAMILVLLSNAKIAGNIVKSENLNFYTLLGREQLYGKIQSYSKIAKELIDNLASGELPEQMEACLKCNPKSIGGFRKQDIIV